jgi:hypothetical protein
LYALVDIQTAADRPAADVREVAHADREDFIAASLLSADCRCLAEIA